MSTRVLILSASVGSGHKVAAAAVEQAFAAHPGVEVHNQDALKLTTRLYQVSASDAYFALVKERPWAVGWLYDYNDEPFKNEQGLGQLWSMLSGQPLAKFIEDYDPDVTICTHFMPAGVVAQLLIERRIRSSLSIITTDYDFQGMWLSRTFSRYFVALDQTKAHLTALGVDPDRVTVSGIPVSADLSAPLEPAAVRARYNLREDQPTILVSAGALGGGPAREIVAQIMQMQTPAQAVVVCGHNHLLRKAVTAQIAEHTDRFRILGFTSEMSDLMRVASIFVGKPGGLTTAECMAAGLPMCVIEPIPGQEERNSDHLLENGAAVRCRESTIIAFKLDRVLQEPGRLAAMRAATARLARPDAAQVVVETLLRDRADPVAFSPEERRQIIATARGTAEVTTVSESAHDVALYHDDTGVMIGSISRQQLQFLVDQLEEESEHDDTYYIDEPTLDYLAGRGADDELLALLREVIEGRGQSEIRFVKP
ncbi:MAG: galactosyldiacylglycerol synthase [Chloroflexales bacterium]|nr:galactosyldiacylglycerol synthase [Chloroflexales bacterium]